MPLTTLAVLMGAAAVDAELRVGAPEPQPVPDFFFGQFAEHLGHSVYPGHWAQLLRNPGFEALDFYESGLEDDRRWLGLPHITAGVEQGLAPYWQPAGRAVYSYDESEPYESYRAQRVDAESGGGVRAPIRPPAHRETRYGLRLYAKAPASLTLQARLTDEDGEALAETLLKVEGGGWRAYEAELRLPAHLPKGTLCYLELTSKEEPAAFALDLVELFPADALEGHDPDVVRYLREAGTTMLRFPGGNFVSGYDWRDGVGPRRTRTIMQNPAWPTVELNHVGTDEWLALARLLGAEPLICVNAGDGAPAAAADWVRYCNAPPDTPRGRLRAKNGHPEPYGVRYWEVGNELWGSWQIGHATPEQYAERYASFRAAMLEADPSVVLIANGGPGDWNQRFLAAVDAPVRSLSMHRLVGQGAPAGVPMDELAMGLAAYGVDLENQLEALHAMCAGMGFPDMRLALTECMSVAPRADGPRSTNRHAEVLFFAGVMNACVRHRDFVELITRTATVNHGGGRAKLMGVAFPEPIHYLSALYAGIEGRRYCPVAADAPGYDVSTPGLPPLKDVPALDAIALMDGPGERLTVVVTNRDVHRAREATISFDAFHPAGEAGTATIAGDPGAYNVWEREPDVRLIHGSAPIEEPLTYTFPPASVVALTFTAAP